MILKSLLICIFMFHFSAESYESGIKDYWETLQEGKGYLTISEFSDIRFSIDEDQGTQYPMLFSVIHFDLPIFKESPWEAGDLVAFKLLSEEYYYVTNLRTQTTVIVYEMYPRIHPVESRNSPNLNR